MDVISTDRRSAINFFIFAIIAVGMTLFILRKAEEAVAEIQKMSELPAMAGHHIKLTTRIIYLNNPKYKGWTETQMRDHCDLMGGTFNLCGSVCADPQKPCIQVCVPECNPF